MLTWDELRPRDVLRIDLEGAVVEGDWPVPLGIPLHLELHKVRPQVQVAMHSHPLYGTCFLGFWEAMARAELRADPSLLDDRG